MTTKEDIKEILMLENELKKRIIHFREGPKNTDITKLLRDASTITKELDNLRSKLIKIESNQFKTDILRLVSIKKESHDAEIQKKISELFKFIKTRLDLELEIEDRVYDELTPTHFWEVDKSEEILDSDEEKLTKELGIEIIEEDFEFKEMFENVSDKILCIRFLDIVKRIFSTICTIEKDLDLLDSRFMAYLESFAKHEKYGNLFLESKNIFKIKFKNRLEDFKRERFNVEDVIAEIKRSES